MHRVHGLCQTYPFAFSFSLFEHFVQVIYNRNQLLYNVSVCASRLASIKHTIFIGRRVSFIMNFIIQNCIFQTIVLVLFMYRKCEWKCLNTLAQKIILNCKPPKIIPSCHLHMQSDSIIRRDEVCMLTEMRST